jgi:hypothetical protein
MRKVEDSADLRRIIALPRREPSLPEEVVDELTRLLKRPGGTMRLRPLQALALHDIGIHGGAFLPLDLGEGKTLISLLAAVLLNAQRPLLLLRANLIRKTAEERDELSKHWEIPNHIRLMSYTMLGLVQSQHDLETYRPDLICCDEVQGLKNEDASVTRRIGRYIEAHPECRFVGMTGTIMSKSILDFAHIVGWALKDGAPVPLDKQVREAFALALDEKVDNEFSRLQPGALLQLANADEIEEAAGDERKAARLGFRRRMRETPGVVMSAATGTKVERSLPSGKKEPVRLTIRPLRYDLSATTAAHFKALRDDKVLPTGEEIWEAAQVWQHARELALGFHQEWDPPAPAWWRAPRREWFSLVREILSRSRTLDSPGHVEQACDLGHLPTGTPIPGDKLEHWRSKLAAWRAVRELFVPNPVPRWHDDSALRVAAEWMREPGIIWVEHIPFGQRLSEMTGARYYGAEGLAADGHFISNAAGEVIIASVDANKEGRNLQRYHRNLIVTIAESPSLMHQLIGRTHRPLQLHDVIVDVFLGCAEHVRAWQKAVAQAHSNRDTVGAQNKLLIADVSSWPSALEMASWVGPRWEK